MVSAQVTIGRVATFRSWSWCLLVQRSSSMETLSSTIGKSEGCGLQYTAWYSQKASRHTFKGAWYQNYPLVFPARVFPNAIGVHEHLKRCLVSKPSVGVSCKGISEWYWCPWAPQEVFLATSTFEQIRNWRRVSWDTYTGLNGVNEHFWGCFHPWNG